MTPRLSKLMVSLLSTPAIAGLASGDAWAASRMLERFNVGGYIRIPGSSNHRLGAHQRPRALPRAAATQRARPGNRAARSAAERYLARFPRTTGLLLIDKGRILFIAYQGLAGPHREFYSMSIGKSLTSLAVGKALCSGRLKSLDRKVGTIVAKLRDSNYGKSTVRQLLTMSSGAYAPRIGGRAHIIGGVGFNPRTGGPYRAGPFWAIRRGQISIADLLWGPVWRRVANRNISPPGKRFVYKNGDTLAVARVVETVTGMTLARYFERTVWRAVGSASGAHWELDDTGATVAASGFQARLADWGRLAQWILEQRARPGCFGQYLRAATSTQINTRPPGGRRTSFFNGYGYQWWTHNRLAPGFWGLGYAGQRLGIDPASGRIVIKFSYATSAAADRALYRLFRTWTARR